LTEIKKHIRYEGIDLKRHLPIGLNATWIGRDEAILQGDDTIFNALGGTITFIEDVAITIDIPEPEPTPEQIAERQRIKDTKKNTFEKELEKVNLELEKEYIKLGGTGNPPKIKSLSEVR